VLTSLVLVTGLITDTSRIGHRASSAFTPWVIFHFLCPTGTTQCITEGEIWQGERTVILPNFTFIGPGMYLKKLEFSNIITQ